MLVGAIRGRITEHIAARLRRLRCATAILAVPPTGVVIGTFIGDDLTMPSLLLDILAAATAPATTQAAPTPGWLEIVRSPMTVVMLCIIVFYIFMIKNKKSQENTRKGMLNQLKRGDRIQTIGGILGTVIEAKDDEVLVKVDESSNTKIRFARSAIHKVLESPKT